MEGVARCIVGDDTWSPSFIGIWRFFLRNIGIWRYELDGLVGATIWDANPSRRRKAWEGAEFG